MYLECFEKNIEEPYKVLIIEDDSSLNLLIQRVLQKIGLSSISFYNGKEAIDWVKNNQSKNYLLLLDYQLSDMNGEQLINELKTDVKCAPFVIFTGQGDEKTAVKMMKLGALDYIIKDSNFLDLLPAVVQQVINNLIVEQKFHLSQVALKKSEEKYRSIFENILDVYFELDAKGIITEISPSVVDNYIYKREELIGKPLFDNKSIENDFLNVLFNKGTITDYQVNLTDKNLNTIPSSITSRVLYDSNDNPQAIVGTIRNVSERKKAEETIRLNEERYRILAENSSDLISKHNWDRTYLYVSPVCKKLLGYEQSEMTGQSAYKYIHPDDIEPIRRNHIFLLENNTTSLIESYRIRKKDGSFLWFETNNQVIYNPITNLVEEIVCVSRDITERKEKEELLKAKEVAERANIAKSELLANMSHEVRNPMNAIVGMANTLSKTKLSEKQKEYLNSILLSGENLVNILNDILDFSKIEANKVELTFTEFNINELVKNAINFIKPACAKKRIKIIQNIDDSIPENLYGDEQKITQIFNNLLDNAVKFTNKGSITVEVIKSEEVNESIKLKSFIKDTGVGVKKQDIHKLFESFKQLDSSTKKEYKGTGLGLSIVKKLVELMNGVVSFESTYGKGSCVCFEVPLMISGTRKSTKQIKKVEEKNSPDSPNSLKILVAEDDAINQIYLANFLKSKGWDVVTASNGQKVLDEYEPGKFDVILMDGQMPKMDGFEATKKIREIENKAGIFTPIIAITGYAIHGDREKFIKAGMNDYITKPIDEAKLYNIIIKLAEK